jgi:hypothetical protein
MASALRTSTDGSWFERYAIAVYLILALVYLSVSGSIA